MEGSAEELGPPDSWEMADLEDSVGRLMVSSSKKDTSLGFVEDPASLDDASSAFAAPPSSSYSASVPNVAAAAGCSDRRGGPPSEELINQVDQFLREALEKPRERLSILRMEQNVENFIRDHRQQQLEFQALPTSYLRLAAHRVAQHYYLQSIAVPDTNVPDGSGSRIVLLKTSECRFPPVRLADIPVNLPQEENHSIVKVAIKQRPQKFSLSTNSSNANSSKTNQLKSVEERKEEYNKARARIFSGNSSGGAGGKPESEPSLPDNLQHFGSVSRHNEDRTVAEAPDFSIGRRLGESSTNSSRPGRVRMEKEPVVNRYKTGNKVAIFRDREVDRKDPDYDRSYDRYVQRFDPGFGFNGGQYTIQPMYTPAVNYNTEFPQLGSAGSAHRPQISIEHQPRQIPQHLRGSWGTASSPTTHGYGPPEGMLSPYSTNHVAVHSPSSVYLHSPQYVAPAHPGMAYVHPHEHIQSFAQTHQQQPEASFGLARPR